MAIQRQGINDWRFRYLDHAEDAFLHSGDPASLKVVIIGGVTRLFWVRDHRNDASSGYPNPIGVTDYVIESGATATGPWTREGSPIAESGLVYYEATLAAADPMRWYRLRTRLADAADYTSFSWPTRPDAAAAGFAYLKARAGSVFVAGMWGGGPPSPGDVVLEWGNQNGWGYVSSATSMGPVNGLTEYSGVVTSVPSGGGWVMRLRSVPQGIVSMKLDPPRRNNRIVDRFGAHLFKPDHPAALDMHRSRLGAMQALNLSGMRLDFALDSFPSWYVATGPVGDDGDYAIIRPHMLAMLDHLKAGYPAMKLFLNGISVTSSYTGIYGYLPPADGVDCEFIGWSAPTATEPFRDADMIDGVIGVAHARGRPVACYSYADPTNLDARMTSLARYWLVYSPIVYYQYMTENYHQSVDYFPEFDIDMGRPEQERLASRADLVEGSVYRRRFSKGIAYYNPTSGPVSVSFGAPYWVVSAQGTYSPKQGGTGSVQFLGPYSSTTLGARRGAIVVASPTTGR
jgi:hypothetical protein